MIKTGQQHLESLKDGRVVYIGEERVDDVITHPAFARAAKTVAQLYDIKHDPVYQDTLTFEEDGERHSAWFLQARSRQDLRKRMKAHKLIADQTCGMMGRSMDHVSSFVTVMATNPSVFNTKEYQLGDNLLALSLIHI